MASSQVARQIDIAGPRHTAELPTPKGRWYVLAVLTAIMTLHHVDRNVVSVVMEPMKREFALSDAAAGMVAGSVHSVAFAVCVLPMGWLADRTNRVRLLTTILAIWSAMTALGAFATSYAALALTRLGVGASEAGGPPATVSMVLDLFRPAERPTAMGLYYLHVAFGTGIIFLGGGWLAHMFGWRAAFLVAGVPGMLLALLLLFTVSEPSRGPDAGTAPNIRQIIATAARSPATLFALTAGTIATFAQTATWAWIVAFFMRAHGLGLGEAGAIVAAMTGVAKGLGTALSGPAVRMTARDDPRRFWRFPAAMLVLSAPLAWGMVLADSTPEAIAWCMALGVAMGCWVGPTMVILVSGTPPRTRASVTSLYHLCTNLIGAGSGPLLVGSLSDALGGGAAIGTAMALALSINLVAALFLGLGARKLPPPATPASVDLI